jgi:peptidyl-prolyl cis-trans isomerase SurA
VSEDVANEAQAQIKAGNSWKILVEEKQGELQGDSGRFELTQINGNANATTGSFSPVTRNADGTATFMQYFKVYVGGEQRNFEDSKGMVINDYQNVVEKRWTEELRKKYPVKVNEVLLKQIVKEAN